MKLSIEMSDPRDQELLERLIKGLLGNQVAIVAQLESEVILADKEAPLIFGLQSAKRAIQLLANPSDKPFLGLKKDYGKLFSVFTLARSKHGGRDRSCGKMLVFLAKLVV